MSGVVVFGGYGAFGSIVCRELAATGIRVRVAGRDAGRAKGLATELGHGHEAILADAGDPASCRAAVAGERVAVHCAGPFAAAGLAVLEACVSEGCHYVDIAEDRAHARHVEERSARVRESGICAAYGCSSLPGISGALALAARKQLGAAARLRITLYVGNDNRKGRAAVAALLATLGRSIERPQGRGRGFRNRRRVRLPGPLGRRPVYDVDSPEYDLLPALLGVHAVEVKVGFELGLANRTMATLAALRVHGGPGLAGFLARAGNALRGPGTSGGAVVADLVASDGRTVRAAAWSEAGAQRMAAWPAVLAARALATAPARRLGACTAYELLGVTPLLDGLREAGYHVDVE